MDRNPQRRKIIHGMRPVGSKDRSIDLNMYICRNIPFYIYYVAVIIAVVLTMHISFSLCCAFVIEGLYFNFIIL